MLQTLQNRNIQAAPSDFVTKTEPQVHVEAVSDSASDTSVSDAASEDQEEPQSAGFDLNVTHLIASPYDELANQLALQPLGHQSRLFAFALTNLTPATPSYATAPYTTAFNWPTIFSTLRTLCSQQEIHWQKQEFYVVIFRSKLREGADRTRLGELDQKAHEEACASGGLLKYWFGSADGERRNLATCLWVSREDAAAGGSGPWHKKARGAAREMYESISFYTHSLIVEDGVTSWDLRDFAG